MIVLSLGRRKSQSESGDAEPLHELANLLLAPQTHMELPGGGEVRPPDHLVAQRHPVSGQVRRATLLHGRAAGLHGFLVGSRGIAEDRGTVVAIKEHGTVRAERTRTNFGE